METPDDMRSWVNERVGAVQRIAGVMIIPSLPHGAMGKILKRKLRDQYKDSFQKSHDLGRKATKRLQ